MILPSQQSPRKHVLLVDDEASLSQMLTLLLETRGYDVLTVSSGTEALQKASDDFDVILLDLVLPDINGFEVCRTLRHKQSTRHIPIIMISAQDLNENKIEGLYLGADDFLAKPCDIEELLARMEAVMRRGILINHQPGDSFNEEIILEIRHVLDNELIVPHFQPIYSLRPMQLMGVEVLSRPLTSTILSNPEQFFKSAVQFGLYQNIELLCWKKALKMISQAGFKEKIFLNCNPIFVEKSRLPEIDALLNRYQLSPQHVILEITERCAIKNYKLFYEALEAFCNYGFKFAIDDVGCGFASLDSIVQRKPHVIKIDRAIIHGLKEEAFRRNVIQFIVSFCRENNILVIAEGIEVEEDLKIVMDLGVDAAQGFFLYKPTPAINLEEMKKIDFHSHLQ